MLAYSALLTLALVLSSPWWLVRMATTQRYREGLRQRLGAVPARLVAAVQGRRVVWVHAVSVGEVLAASQLVGELEVALGEGFRVVISTTTRTGQALARERFGAERVFYMPLDFAFSVRAYLRALKPVALVLMESELWPRMLSECGRRGVPVVVANARMSDRSFARAMRVQWIWGRVMRKPALWLAQSEEDARRFVGVGARAGSVKVAGNMKYDIRAPKESRMPELDSHCGGGASDLRRWKHGGGSSCGRGVGDCSLEAVAECCAEYAAGAGAASSRAVSSGGGVAAAFRYVRRASGRRGAMRGWFQQEASRLFCSIRLAIWLQCIASRMWPLSEVAWSRRAAIILWSRRSLACRW